MLFKKKKGKADALRGSVFTKIGRELAVAVKQGGADPSGNARLRDVIAKAKQNNMPNDNIARSIKKASGELNTVNYEDMVYEGYASGGIAVIVEALTDNKNRTAGDIRHFFDKYGGALGQTGCVSFMFKRKGIIIAEKDNRTEDDMMMLALEAGAEDLAEYDDVFEILTAPQDLSNIASELEKQGVKIISQSSDMIPDTPTDPGVHLEKVIKLLDALEENDDIQNVYHNAILPEE
ncbi:MAG: YebC/PmpR family DNA-binding transcriptional regulator [Firmicutes bacterium]|nr:YebC/PmpR family DNA-binding transcriptional regulator [Bacillota bacterium]